MSTENTADDNLSPATRVERSIAAKWAEYQRTHRVDNQGRVHEIDPKTGEDIAKAKP